MRYFQIIFTRSIDSDPLYSNAEKELLIIIESTIVDAVNLK